MKKTRISALPLVVVLAVVALVVGTFGTAQAAGLTATKVKKIAGKVVDHKAASLSVAHAATADNAGTVDGLDSTQLQSRIVEGTETAPSGGALLSGDATIATVTITAPAAGYVKVTGQAYLNASAGSNYMYAYVYEGTTKLKSLPWDGGDKDGFYDQSQSIVAVAPVTAGTHTYTLHVTESTGGAFFAYGGGQLIAEYYGAGSAPAGPGFKPGQ
jgi:uncharacterized membrane protein YphA (DoxX/SURF4 family)